MEILSYVIYGVGVLLTLIWLAGIRVNTNSGQGVAATTVNTTLLFIVSLILIPALELSLFHLIWLFGASAMIGMLSGVFPFSILSVPGRVLWRLVCLGIDTSNMTENGIYGMNRAQFDAFVDESLSSKEGQ